MSNHINKVHEGQSHSYGVFFLVWLSLLILTGLTVSVAGLNFGAFTTAIAMLIASVKSYFVLSVFMHLKFEQKIFKVFVAVALIFLVISLVLLFSDYSYLQQR